MRLQRVNRQAGFTLLEVMIALAITGGLLVTLLHTINRQLGFADEAQTATLAMTLCREKLEEIKEKPSITGEGTFPEPWAAYVYNTTIEESGYSGVVRVSVTVRSGKAEVRLRELIRSGAMGK